MKRFKTVHYTIHSNKIKDARGIRFAVIADLHGMEFDTDNRKLPETIHRYRPDRINLVFLPADDGLVNRIQFLQRETCQKLLWIYRLSVLQYLIRNSGLFKEYICRIVHLVL